MSFLFFDTEDNSEELLNDKINIAGWDRKITQIAAIDSYGNRFHFGCDANKFLHFVETSEYSKIYAHNVAYDIGALLRDRLDELDAYFVGGRLIKAIWRGKIFLDTHNIFPMALAKLGETFKIKKLQRNVHSKRYVYRDCEIGVQALKFVNEFVGEFGVEKVRNTLGGVATQIYHAMGGNHEFCDLSFDMEPIPYLFGGRVELFKDKHLSKSGNILYCDINSLYPYVMTQEFPIECAPQNHLEGYGIAAVELDVPEMFVCPLPVRTENGSIIYPHGKLFGIWTLHEIRNAIACGSKLKRIYFAIGTQKTKKYYARFVKNLYARRKSATSEAEKLMLKLCMNNLYGQLATSGKITRYCVPTEDRVLNSEGQMVGKKILHTYEMPLPAHTNYIHAAYVTAYGRLKLMECLNKIGEKDLIYCDTDSVIFDGRNGNPFKITDELGGMKLEGKASIVQTWAPKMYRFENKYRAKGVKSDAAELFCKTGKAEMVLPYRLREAIHFYDDDQITKRFRASVWRRITKERRHKYDKKDLHKGIYFPKLIDMRESHKGFLQLIKQISKGISA